MTKRIIYPGTFDPVTNGHLDIVDRALDMFGSLEIAVGENPSKTTLFSQAERVALLADSLGDRKNIQIRQFSGLLVDYAGAHEHAILIRGLRAVSDFEYELQMAMMNRRLNPLVETIFLMPNYRHIFLSSSIIKDVARHKGDISPFVPEKVNQALRNKFQEGA
ncbi:MAG: pantetheine-phosphate adenylyltransferase [Candidatus Raymondbacteria bacterium RifOxyA12_full_50_37]|uniref:Phosphopantetheine adenylyltransferase n=1 Tax=Candidatus Raymondbacteria bacterium RIFOXYD12_FULL_49_13 TaxID=1817890 RepID=A0A1F7F1K2_UNCRA|nr:MAG: pantetheine-phosphate adenylyltransferase [Candidatus Raymondbacteria bacterium RifOxyA12_full_50_37]OGJ93863.1 MAG: pantetheine-phosphate adenylyltransferase [Candidatus Raymondbacteria bacterium RIFOXYA2_FULL_49_16]OGJ98268.1 MAG: pantetheine-phosphate adenylyltransferase [Candidatus Raymondbacteria bacterium RIFOXYC2_FULL_50_21]OGJ98432.1 MAG: pantetheine-phosphate adenylyltransferase [Candidatus Raymondbacteria bacterium RifOxyB12_full_50_8]OGK00501.1 MAG: pantetheine-phosphate aden